ncbi:MAG: folate-binding protein [Zetaproteobacteria bacterium]|nr:MAG: folate-binding protein [Zetaproteobacteria bacterium]
MRIPTLSPATAEQLLTSHVIGMRYQWRVLKITGKDTASFLQGQMTQDIRLLTPAQAIHACVLTPQGKAVSEIYVLMADEQEYLMLAPACAAEALVTRLRQFALGHQVRIGILPSFAVCSVQGAHAHAGLAPFELEQPGSSWLSTTFHPKHALAAMTMPADPAGYWLVGPEDMLKAHMESAHAVDEEELEAMRIIRGIPMFGKEWDASVHPLNANLIELHGVSFNKGCYVGQEVTSRMHWRGAIRKKLYRLRLGNAPIVLPCAIHQGGQAVGQLRSAAIDHQGSVFGIALLPIASAEKQGTLDMGGTPVTVIEPCHA